MNNRPGSDLRFVPHLKQGLTSIRKWSYILPQLIFLYPYMTRLIIIIIIIMIIIVTIIIIIIIIKAI